MTRWMIHLGAAVAMAAMWVPGAGAVIVDSPSIALLAMDDVVAMPEVLPAGAGLGLLDLVLLAPSGGGSLNNPAGVLNFDNSNTDMAAGTTATANESYLTSVGELRDFYRLNFPDGSGGSTVNELLLWSKINEAGSPGTLTLEELTLVVDYSIPDSATAQNPAANDLTATAQNAVNGTFEEGTGTRLLKLAGPFELTDLHAGPADYALKTGLNPFDPSLADGTRLVVNWRGSGHDSAGETLFLSGAVGPANLCAECGPPPPSPDPDPEPQPGPGPVAESPDPVVPEPASWLLSLLGLGMTVLKRR